MDRVLKESEYQALLQKQVTINVYISEKETIASVSVSSPYDTDEDVKSILAQFRNDMNANFDSRHDQLLWIEKLYYKIPNWIRRIFA
jgi:hypothetical protein